MKVLPDGKEGWSNALLSLPLILLLFFSALGFLTMYLSTWWLLDDFGRCRLYEDMGVLSFCSAGGFTFLLFVAAIVFAAWEDWRRAFWACFCVAAWILAFMLIATAFALTH